MVLTAVALFSSIALTYVSNTTGTLNNTSCDVEHDSTLNTHLESYISSTEFSSPTLMEEGYYENHIQFTYDDVHLVGSTGSTSSTYEGFLVFGIQCVYNQDDDEYTYSMYCSYSTNPINIYIYPSSLYFITNSNSYYVDPEQFDYFDIPYTDSDTFTFDVLTTQTPQRVSAIGFNFYVSQFDASYVESTEYEQGYKDGYAQGVDSGDQISYDNGYHTGYDDGYYTGYGTGKQEGYALGQTADTNLRDVFFNIADVPIITIRGLFDFELFGMSMYAFVGSLIALFFMLLVVRKVF